ncbi:MAG: hypothetical protein LBB22_03585 [Treponema sp.]|jgi:hypothetical protein|nr:hypothetical protein [Treponema sp.]
MRIRTVFYSALLFFSVDAIFNLKAAVSTGIYQTPPVLYVGDRGSLVYQLDMFMPLPESDIVFPNGFPKSDDIIIHKIDIDRRGRRVIIEFQAFRTGTVPLPPIPFGGAELKGLQVNIASILDSANRSMTLSPSAGMLTAPGTLWIITAFSALLAILLAALVLLYAKGGAFFTGARNALRTHILLFWINSRMRRLENRLKLGRITEKEALAILSNEVRSFLSRFWMQPCYAMSAEEFLYFDLPRQNAATEIITAGVTVNSQADNSKLLLALYGFFKKCDGIRFAATAVTQMTVSEICAEAKSLVNGKDLTES